MTISTILSQTSSLGIELIPHGDRIKIRGPGPVITDHLVESLRKYKRELLAALKDRQEACEERTAILEYHDEFERDTADREARARIRFVTCDSCAHWTRESQCGVGLHIDDKVSGRMVRICGFHSPRRHQQ